MKVSEMVQMTREVSSMFDQVVPRAWTVEAMVVELSGEVGTLADGIMIKEGYRPPRRGKSPDIEDELVDVVFMLIRVADHYGINLEEAYARMIDKTRTKLEALIREGGG